MSNRFLLLFLLLISLSSCDWDAVIFYYDGTTQGPVATDEFNIITSVSYIYEGRDGTNYGPSSSKPTNIGKYKVSASGTINYGMGTESFGPETDPSNSTNFEILPANSRISASMTIDQAWVDANSAGPWTISASSVTVTFGENFTISNTNQYFIISGSNVTINGANKIVTISGVADYNGLVNASASNASTAIIKNIGLVTQNSSTLNQYKGWISQTSNKANIINCYSTGNITNNNSGGIAGQSNSGYISNCHSSGNINGLNSGGIAGQSNSGYISNCYTSGNISGQYTGGIAADNNSGNISICYSTGPISGIQAGGIAGERNSGNISNCYTSGNISGNGAGGIAAYYNGGTISNCYTSGNISGQNSGGIAGYDGSGAIFNCYTSGSISGQESGGIAGNYYTGAISNCRSSGTLTPGGSRDIILGIPSTGTISNSINVTPTTPNTWDNLIANQALIELGTIWDQSNTPYTLFPPPLINITLVTATLTSCSGSSSTQTTFGVSGSGLTASVTISAPSGFEISTSSGGTYSSSLTLTNTPTVSQTLYVRLNSSATAGDKTGTITATSTGASDVTTTVSGTVNAFPTILISDTDVSGSATNDNKVCIGGLATLTASGGSTYSWSTSDLTVSITQSISSNTTYTVTGTTAGCSNTASITITVESLPTLSLGSISLSNESTYLITKTTSVSNNDSWTVSGTITVNNGYVTAGTTPGTYTVSYTDGCAQTVSATVTVATTSSLPAITDGLASYKFNNNPQGPLGSGDVIYMGYNGFNYSSTTRPTNTGFYRANNVSGSSAGSPTQFYIFRCTTCGTVSSFGTRPQGTLSGNTNGTGQLTYTSSNGGGPFTIVYQATGGSPVTINNISSTVAFNVVTPTITTSYKLISVTDENTKATTDFSGTSATITVNIPHYVGESYGGGIVFYITDGGAHGLIAAPTDQSSGIIWGPNYTITGATGTAIGTGLANTSTIITIQGGTPTSYAAGLARAYNGGGYTNWYLPSKDELNLMYTKIGKGASSPNYNIGNFAPLYYWSSTEYNENEPWTQEFNNGGQNYFSNLKSSTLYVRAIRSF